MDMMNGKMADAMNCMEKEMEVSCQDETYRKQVFVPFWYCMVAVGERDPGPVPPCNGPIKFGDASKCKKTEKQIKDEIEMAKSMCFDKLKQLYDLQGKLGQCAADISTEKQKVEEERQGLQDIQQETQECEKKSATAKAEQSMAGFSADESSGGQFCPAFAAELKAAFAKYTLAVEQCISVQISAQVHIPEINIKIPEIQVGEISGTSFNIQMPDFKAPDFTGDIVVPASLLETFLTVSNYLHCNRCRQSLGYSYEDPNERARSPAEAGS